MKKILGVGLAIFLIASVALAAGPKGDRYDDIRVNPGANISLMNGASSLLTTESGNLILTSKTGTVAVMGALTVSGAFSPDTIVAANGMTITAGGLTVTAGGIGVTADGMTITAGGLEITADDLTVVAGDIEASAGAISAGTTVTAGTGVTATTGDIVATAGAVTAGTGVTATTGGVTASAGDITATLDDIVASAGNIEATLGTITAGSHIESTGGHVQAFNIQTASVTAGTGGALNRSYAEATQVLAGASQVVTLNIPTGAKIAGVSINVDTEITYGGGGATWSAAYSGGCLTSIGTALTNAKNTKVNVLYDTNAASDITTNTTNITLTPDAGTFAGGAVTVVVYYDQLTQLSDKP